MTYTSSRSRRRNYTLLAGGVAFGGFVLSACTNPDSAVGFQEVSPNARFRAIHEAAKSRDPAAVRDLIGRLESDDPAERLLAIRTLEEITGQTLGYQHSGDKEDREAAIGRWVEWYAHEHPSSVSQASAQPAAIPE